MEDNGLKTRRTNWEQEKCDTQSAFALVFMTSLLSAGQ